MSQRVTNLGTEPEPAGEACTDLAVLRHAAPLAALVRQRPCELAGPTMPRQVLGQVADEVAQLSPRSASSIGANVALKMISSPPAAIAVSAASEVQPRNRNSAV
jgi:hypothetical protein